MNYNLLFFSISRRSACLCFGRLDLGSRKIKFELARFVLYNMFLKMLHCSTTYKIWCGKEFRPFVIKKF